MGQITTNIFCVIGKPGTNKSKLVSSVLSTIDEKYHLERFLCGTTRVMKSSDTDWGEYYLYSKEEFDNMEPSRIIECRTRDGLFTSEVDRYFTLTDHITIGKNYIGKMSLFQYVEIKKWAAIYQMRQPSEQINFYPIYIASTIHDRLQRLIARSKTEDDIYRSCALVIGERYEFQEVSESQIIDNSNPNNCTINYGQDCGVEDIAEKIIAFIIDKL